MADGSGGNFFDGFNDDSSGADDFDAIGRLPRQVHEPDDDAPITLQEARFVEMYLSGARITDAYTDTHKEADKLDQSERKKAAYRLLDSKRVQDYLNKVRTVKREERNAAAPGDIIAHIRDGENLSPLQLLEKTIADLMEGGSIVVDVETQHKRLWATYLHCMMARQYGSAISALREMSELAGLKIERKQIVIANIDDMSADQLVNAVTNQRQQLIELGYDPSDLDWIPTDDGQHIAAPAGNGAGRSTKH